MTARNHRAGGPWLTRRTAASASRRARPFEEEIGFTRALRVGNQIFVSGTIGVEADGSVSPRPGARPTAASS